MNAERPWLVTRADGQSRIIVHVDPAALADDVAADALWPGRLFGVTAVAFLLAAIIVATLVATGRF